MPKGAAGHSRGQGIRLGKFARLGGEGRRLLGFGPWWPKATSVFTALTWWQWEYLPLQFLPGDNAETLKLTGEEV